MKGECDACGWPCMADGRPLDCGVTQDCADEDCCCATCRTPEE